MIPCIHVIRLNQKCKCKDKHLCGVTKEEIFPRSDCGETCKAYDPDIPQIPLELMYEEYRNKFDKVLIESNPGEHYGSGAGDGIVYVGGGKYWPGIYVGIKLLRQFGCNLPIEVWYRGSCEQVFSDDVEGLNVTLVDVDKIGQTYNDSTIPLGNPKSGGWEAKLYSLYHTNFDRTMFLDADAYCVENPERLFRLLDEYDFVYWRDLSNQLYSIKWDKVYPEGKVKGVPPVQGGQLLIDRKDAWKLIHLANYMCQNSTYYFKCMYGDQDTWRVGLSAGLAKGYVIDKAEWSNVAFNCKYEGKSYVIHRCQGKLFHPEHIPERKVRYSNPQYYLPKEEQVFNLLAEVLNKRPIDAVKTFKEIYERRLWGIQPSGNGTLLKEARPYIKFVDDLIKSKGYTSVVDAGCGDGYISNFYECTDYRGYDCYINCARNLSRKFPKNCYIPLDIYENYDMMTGGDLLVCKDVLHHWPVNMIVQWLENLIQSKKWKTILLCQDYKQMSESQDCYLGGYRALNHTMKPLNQFPLKHALRYLHKDILIHE